MNNSMKSLFSISIFLSASIFCTPTHASLWDDLWNTRDQQASKAFDKKEYEKAAELFKNEQWQGASRYKKGDFDAATIQFSKQDDIESLYNKGNSLAKAQQFQQALESYAQVLEKSPSHEDTLFNKKIVEELLKQQKEKQDQEDKDQENKEKQDSESESESESEQDPEKKPEEKENSEQQKSEQESKEESDKQAEEKQAQMSQDERDQNEKDQALEHWLEKIPDDPGGLLRRKMYREYQRRGRQQKEKKIW